MSKDKPSKKQKDVRVLALTSVLDKIIEHKNSIINTGDDIYVSYVNGLSYTVKTINLELQNLKLKRLFKLVINKKGGNQTVNN